MAQDIGSTATGVSMITRPKVIVSQPARAHDKAKDKLRRVFLLSESYGVLMCPLLEAYVLQPVAADTQTGPRTVAASSHPVDIRSGSR